MHLLKFIRIIVLCTLLTIVLLSRQRGVYAQSGACQTWATLPICCISPGCTNPNSCAAEIQGSTGPGHQSITFQDVTCHPAVNSNGACGSFTDSVPFDDPSCFGQPGDPCFDDSDCFRNLQCNDGLCGPPVEDPPVD